MINLENLILGKEDKPIVFTLKDAAGAAQNFADLDDVQVVLAINKVAVATYKASDEPATVVAISGEDDKCKILITKEQQTSWHTGLLEVQITTVITDSDFSGGRHTSQWANLYYCKNGF